MLSNLKHKFNESTDDFHDRVKSNIQTIAQEVINKQVGESKKEKMDAIQEMTNAFGILLFINGLQKDIKEKIHNEPHIGNYIIVNFFLEILLFFILHTFIPCKSG